MVDAWGALDPGDEQHQDGRPQQAREETEAAVSRFRFATPRRRIPLSSDPSPARTLTIDAEPPPARLPDGSSPGIRADREIAPIAVEVRLRRNLPPSAAQVDDVLAWLTRHRVASGTPRPQPVRPPEPPPPALQPVIRVEPARRGSRWPLVAVTVGLAAALVAAILL